jgi:hypothetical protein
MKKIFATAVIIFTTYCSFAQNSGVFEKGTNVINAGLGLGNVYWGSTGYGNSGLPISLQASFDHGITDKLGIGYIGVGGILGYTSTKFTGNNQGYSYAYTGTGILIGARATYHFALAGAIGEKLDPYAGVLLGYVIVSSSYSSVYGSNGQYSKGSAVAAGAFVGAHYYFVPNFGVHAEIGYNIISIFNTGLTFKF